MPDFYIIEGQKYEDHRGIVMSANALNMQEIMRHYILTHTDTNVIRAWQGHQYETKWMKCLQGIFTINLVKSDNMECPSIESKVEVVTLNDTNGDFLCVPGGYFTGLKAETEMASLLIFSDFMMKESIKDDFRRPIDFWNFKREQ